MSGKVSDLPIRYKHAVFTQKKLDRINFRSGNGGRVLRNPPGVTRCWSRAWSHDSLSHGFDKMADPVMLSTFGVQLLMFVQVVVTFMPVRQVSVLPSGIDVRKVQRSHSEISRVEPLSDLPIRFSVLSHTFSDLTLYRSKVRSDRLLCMSIALDMCMTTNMA